MPLSLTCSCGARFEVEDHLAGQTVQCPECQQPVAVAAAPAQPMRTSGLAIASVVLALVGAFTGIGTVLAVVLGGVALVQIRKHPRAIAGTGYAILGIACGLIFSGLFFLAILQAEVFGVDMLRDRLMSHNLDRDGPLEITRPADGFAIRRPSSQWGVARPNLASDLAPASQVLLVHPGKNAFIDVACEDLNGRSLDACKDAVLQTFRGNRNDFAPRALRYRDLEVEYTKPLAPVPAGDEGLEMVFRVGFGGERLTYLVRIIRQGTDVYVIRSWTQRNRFLMVEPELRQALDSFRILRP
ncbi:hypothetical protein AYO44_17615 [Planctomycetaceae bacterium SCGC AG-212-F19]|nr:hypothetical protein AYO44_17615 [Planctomycetaceae bacterium SCGC AG-212-F19]